MRSTRQHRIANRNNTSNSNSALTQRSPMHRLLIAMLLLCTGIAHAAPQRIFIAGDSTAAEYGAERAPQAGWGQLLQDWFDPAQWQVHNHAKGGRSTRSFIAEGRLDAIARELQRGDVLLIQFGHNDAKREDPTRYTDPTTDYMQFLRRYIAAARDKGATPILITRPRACSTTSARCSTPMAATPWPCSNLPRRNTWA